MYILPGTGDTSIELGNDNNPNRSSGNQYAYMDIVGDDTYWDFGLRMIRGNGGPNTFSQIVHRGTGDLQLYAQDGGGCSLTANDFRIRNNFRGHLGPASVSQSGSSTSGMRFLTNFKSGWLTGQPGYSIDSGISVNQGDGLGCLICLYHHTASATQHSGRAYFITLSFSQSSIDVQEFATRSGSFGSASFGVSAQGTLTMLGAKGSNYFHLIAVGNLMV